MQREVAFVLLSPLLLSRFPMLRGLCSSSFMLHMDACSLRIVWVMFLL